MEAQQSPTVPTQRTGQKMSLLALLFFMMGALHIYGKIQRDNQDDPETGLEIDHLLKASLVAVAVAGLMEILTL